MRLYERLLGRSERSALSFDTWQEYFTYNGNGYPIVQTSLGTMSEEQLAQTTYQAYVSNGPTFALVHARMQVFSQVRFQWTRFVGGAPSDLFGSQGLALLERPWPGGTTSDLLARMELDVSTAGNAYIFRAASDRVNVLRPEWMSIVLGSQTDAEHPSEAPDVEVAGYYYKPPNAPHQMWTAQENRVAHYAPIPDPVYRFLGMSWVTPVLTDVGADSAQTLHKRQFMKNAATPNLAIRFDPTVTVERVREFKKLLESEHRGVANAYKTLYLGGGADSKVIGKDFKEIDFAATQGKGESRLAAAAGVPPSWVGFSEGLQGSALNAGNFGAAGRRRFGDATMQHLWMNAAASLEPIVTPPDAGAQLWFSTKGIPFLMQDAQDAAQIQSLEATTIGQLIKDGFTPESAKAAVQNHDWTLLKHTGLTSVQLQPPSNGTEPLAGFGSPAANGMNGAKP